MREGAPSPGAYALLYGRFSSDMQNPLSADDQIRLCEEYAARQKWQIGGRFKDEARTGRTLRKRPGYYDLLAAVEAGLGQVVLVEDISRLGRDAAELQNAARKFREANVVICTPYGGVMTPLEFAIRAQMAEEYSRETGRRVYRGHRSAAGRGRVMGGVAYGYRIVRDPQTLESRRVVHPHQASIIVEACEDYVAGMSPRKICEKFNGRGEPAPDSKLWKPGRLIGNRRYQNGIFRNPLYAGKLIFGKTRTQFISSTGQVRVNEGPVDERVEVDVPELRIVPPELWEAVQEKVNSAIPVVPNDVRRPTYLLSGLSFCGVCGESYPVLASHMGCSGRKAGNGCDNRRRVPRENLERAVLSGLKEKVLKRHLVELFLEEYRQELNKAAAVYDQRESSLRSQKRDLDSKIGNLMKAVQAGATGFSLRLLNEELNALGAQRKLVETELARRPGPPDDIDGATMAGRLAEFIDHLGEAVTGSERDAARARDIVRGFITKITITPVPVQGGSDGRGSGPVRIDVEGSWTGLVGQHLLDRKTLQRGSAACMQNLPILPLRYSVDLVQHHGNVTPARQAAVPIIEAALKTADAPVSFVELRELVSAAGIAVASHATRNALAYLRRKKSARAVRLAYGRAGWELTAPIEEGERKASEEVPTETTALSDAGRAPGLLRGAATAEGNDNFPDRRRRYRRTSAAQCDLPLSPLLGARRRAS